MAAAVLLAASLLSPLAHAQTTIKPFQVRVEVPTGFGGTMLLTNNVLKVTTNGASILDGTGTNWIIGSSSTDGFVSQTNWPAGSTAFFRLFKR